MIIAIVPAAGLSARFGRNKLLLPFGGKPMIAHVIDTLLASDVDEIIVVLGHESERVKEAIGEREVKLVENLQYRNGLSTSINAGLAAISSGASAIMIYLADQPLIEPEEVNFLIRSFAEAEKANKSIVVPLSMNRNQHARRAGAANAAGPMSGDGYVV